jgi:Rieske Fe-S protein
VSNRPTGRRQLLRTLIALPAALMATALTACETTIARLRGWRLTPVARVDQVLDGSAYRTTVGDKPLVLVNVGGDIRTFLAVCTHEGCPLGWNAQQHLIRCPCHGSAFDTSGKVVNGPAVQSLTRLETIVDDGEILLVER